MCIYRIRNSLSPRIIGKTYPQVEKVIIPTTWDDPNYIGNYIFEKPNENVLVPKAVLSSKSKLTDLISAASVGLTTNLLISDRLKILIENSKNSGIIFFKTTLIHPKIQNEIPYWILHSFDSAYEILDLQQSSFSLVNDEIAMNVKAPINFHSSEQIRRRYKDIYDKAFRNPPESEYLIIDKIIFKEKAEIDFFSLRNILNGGIGYYVSEDLKTEMEKEGCTGMVFRKPNEPYP